MTIVSIVEKIKSVISTDLYFLMISTVDLNVYKLERPQFGGPPPTCPWVASRLEKM